ncbi:unnamed protein product [Lupinus luteus]|uniref:Reverse transcriptase zinc-binding domain-containing protein n=1 Tax=Lupinus luteus TaxID=3873 RepID=A0AAV1WF59_LUPLU
MRCLVWRISLEGVLTNLNLLCRGILGVQDTKTCVFCEMVDESTNHLFFSCSKSYCVW